MSETCCDTEESYAETATVNVFELSTSSVKDAMNKGRIKISEDKEILAEQLSFKRFKSQGEEIDCENHLLDS